MLNNDFKVHVVKSFINTVSSAIISNGNHSNMWLHIPIDLIISRELPLIIMTIKHLDIDQAR